MRRAWILLVVAALFVVGFIANVITDDVRLDDTLFQAIAIAVSLAAYAFLRRQQRRREELERFLADNVEQIRAATATFEGVPVTYATQLDVYEIVMSFLIITVRYPTRPVLVGAPGSRSLRAFAIATSLVLGWWGLPWGPIWTVRSVSRNARRTKRISVGELIEGTAQSELAPARAR